MPTTSVLTVNFEGVSNDTVKIARGEDCKRSGLVKELLYLHLHRTKRPLRLHNFAV
jgi:hypothetical protein